jgi:hypothetical protein
MKIKIPFTTKQIVVDPMFEGILVMLSIYTLFAVAIILFSLLGSKTFFIFAASFFITGFIKTSKIEETGVRDVEEEKECKN